MVDTNIFRPEYRELSDEEKQSLRDIKMEAERLLWTIHKAYPAGASLSAPTQSRCLSLARTKLEEAVMWAVKGITG